MWRKWSQRTGKVLSEDFVLRRDMQSMTPRTLYFTHLVSYVDSEKS